MESNQIDFQDISVLHIPICLASFTTTNPQQVEKSRIQNIAFGLILLAITVEMIG